MAGPPGSGERLIEAMELMFAGSSMVRRRFAVEVIELHSDGSPTTIGASIVRAWEVNHGMRGGPFLGLRLDIGGKTIAYLRGYGMD